MSQASPSIVGATVNGVARIEIARPEKKNAITAAMYQLWPMQLQRRTMIPPPVRF